MFSTLRRFKHAASVMAIGMVLSVAAVDFAEARRAGSSGFGSRGTRTFAAPPATRTAPTDAAPIQRSMTPNQATNPGQASQAAQGAQAAQPRRGLFGGIGGGLLGGLFLGGLFGMMMGNGFGGLAGMMGLLFQMLLIGGLIFLLMRMFARRSQPAHGAQGAAGRHAYQAPPPATGHGFKIPQMGSAGAAPAAAAARSAPRTASKATDEIGITNQDLDAFESLLGQVQTAYGQEDYAKLREVSTPEAMSYLAEELSENATQGLKNDVKDVQLLQGDLAESWRENGQDYATVALRYQSIDVMRNRQTGAVVQGNPDEPGESTEIWTFVRKPGEAWKLSAIQGTN
ncbi:Tim44 domain-containing protein [Rhizobium sp. SSA_523]|uniref:Tim44 domain-containing protein n=1 Tax=Rhizobium sp. SSA_523 TaxID=2952477 RepID=UPI0020914116|nr:Tim44 domain-containing protein [Rhizobium sp. SSA_523]MCO5732013.1 Tim44 domain-containing protein [Rhizobium sp. SSA_523]WKC22647.1 Tim44 domain-containing protein [Rhizobium sp. SSA_523]